MANTPFLFADKGVKLELKPPDLGASNWQFAKVVPFFLIVKIITAFELVRGHTQFNQSIDLTHQN
jgi:hypothetical protein